MNSRLAKVLADNGVQPTEALLEAITSEVWDVIAEQDPSPKAILHEPFRSIADTTVECLRSGDGYKSGGFHKIGDIVVIRVEEPNGFGTQLLDRYFAKDEGGNWWKEITKQDFYQRKEQISKVQT